MEHYIANITHNYKIYAKSIAQNNSMIYNRPCEIYMSGNLIVFVYMMQAD